MRTLEAALVLDETSYSTIVIRNVNNKKINNEIPIIHSVSIGSAPDNTITISNKRIAKKQFKIIRKNNLYTLTDINSKYKTKINGKEIKKDTILKNNDLIEIEDFNFIFHDENHNRAPGI